MFRKIVFVTFVLSQCARGQDTQKGSCGADIVGMLDFDINDYAGTWYQIERIDNEFEGACIRAEFQPVGDGNLTLSVTQVMNGQPEYRGGVARVDSSDGSGRLELISKFPVGESFVEFSEHLYVMALDTTSYAFIMACDDSDGYSRSVYASKLSRTRSLTPQAISAIDDVVAASPSLFSVTWKQTDQSVETCGSSASDAI